jgi:hypothetical protein
MNDNHITGKLVDGQILITVEEAHRVSTIIDKLEEQNKLMREALGRIAYEKETSFADNPDMYQWCAQQCLKEIGGKE